MHFLHFLFHSRSINIIILIFFIFSLISQLSLLDYFFIWHPISDPSDLMAHSQHRLPGDSYRQSDLPLLVSHFSQNHMGLNEGDLVLSLTHLHLHRNSQAGNEVSFLIPLLYSVKFQHLLRINFCMQWKIIWKLTEKQKNA